MARPLHALVLLHMLSWALMRLDSSTQTRAACSKAGLMHADLSLQYRET